MSKELSTKSAFQVITTDLEVTMDDVVSAFVATYENNLFDRKKELKVTATGINKSLEDLDKKVLAVVTGEQFAKSIEVYDLVVKVCDSNIVWADNQVRFPIEITINAEDREAGNYSYGNSKISLKRYLPIPERFTTEYTQLNADLTTVRGELGEVLEGIKSIARKERQVRGRIAIRKLEDAGYESLLGDPELAQLVEL